MENKELKEVKAELSAANLTISNIQNALNLPGKKGISLEVIELVNELAAENSSMKNINYWIGSGVFIDMNAAFCVARSVGCNNEDCMHDALRAALISAPNTKASDSIIAEIKAQAVMDAIDAVSQSGALTLSDVVIALTAYSAKLHGGN